MSDNDVAISSGSACSSSSGKPSQILKIWDMIIINLIQIFVLV